MRNRTPTPAWRPLLPLMLLGLLLLASAGCATSDESDMPWNTPQSWEGSPTIPGLSSPDY